MNIFKTIWRWLSRPVDKQLSLPRAKPQATKPVSRRVPWDRLIQAIRNGVDPGGQPVVRYEPAPGVVPAAELGSTLAMDTTPYDYLMASNVYGQFLGYPFLAQLAQLPEFRKMASLPADHMTRKWIKLKYNGDSTAKTAERLTQLETALKRFKVKEVIREAIEHDNLYGRGQIYLDLKTPSGSLAADNSDELAKQLFMSNKKIKKGSLVGLKVVEPVWTYPGQYNATNPLAGNYYKPDIWYVMGKSVHASRLIMLTARPVPDLLKAAYSFGGLSISQLAKPYVDNWLRTRDSISDIVHSFSTSGLATDMAAYVNGFDDESETDLIKRVEFYNVNRDNRGTFLIDKETEEFFQFNVPLGGLDHLQAQAQEQMSAVSNLPLVILTGITPSGLNASSDGEIRVFYDYIMSQNENVVREPLKRILDVIQLSEFGEIDPDFTFEFEPLFQLSATEQAAARKTDADTGAVLINAGVIQPMEERVRVARDPQSPYMGLDTDVDDDAPDSTTEREAGQANEADTNDSTDNQRVRSS